MYNGPREAHPRGARAYRHGGGLGVHNWAGLQGRV